MPYAASELLSGHLLERTAASLLKKHQGRPWLGPTSIGPVTHALQFARSQHAAIHKAMPSGVDTFTGSGIEPVSLACRTSPTLCVQPTQGSGPGGGNGGATPRATIDCFIGQVFDEIAAALLKKHHGSPGPQSLGRIRIVSPKKEHILRFKKEIVRCSGVPRPSGSEPLRCIASSAALLALGISSS